MSPAGWASVCCAALAAACLVPARAPSVGPARPGPTAPDGHGPGPRVLLAGAAAAGTAVLLGHLPGLLLAPVAGAAAWRWSGTVQSRAERRSHEALTRALPVVVDLMAACLAAGASPPAALGRVATAVDPPMREELRAVAARLHLGTDPVTVWEELGRHPELGPLGRAMARAVRSGASVAEAMGRLAEDLRRASRTELEARARAVAVKAAAPLGLCLLPAFVLVGVVPLIAGTVSRVLAP